MTELNNAIIKLRELGLTDTSSGEAARSVLLHMWNSNYSISGFHLFDPSNHHAAIRILQERWIEDSYLQSLVPEIRDWQRNK